MAIAGVHHIAISVRDLDASKRFYGTALGFEEAERPDVPFPGVWYQLGAQQLHLFVSDSGQAGSGHFAISIAGDGYLEYIERIQSRGAELLREPSKGLDGVYRAFVNDPDGNTMEITDGQAARPA